MVFYRWEDVVRYEPYRLDFGLCLKGGRKVRFPVEAKDFKEVKEFILQSLERIGTFEDGRKVPRELFSISIKTLVWICIAIAVVIVIALVYK